MTFKRFVVNKSDWEYQRMWYMAPNVTVHLILKDEVAMIFGEIETHMTTYKGKSK